MLYLDPPFYIIEGVSIFKDHADPQQFYFLPMAPKLTKLTDEATGQRIPQIQVIKYRGTAGNGGFLNFDVNIGVDQEKLDTIRDEIRSKERLRDPPRLSPVTLVDGSVRMMLFGTQTGEPVTAETPSIKFVTKIDQNAKPSLYGDNQAAFSVSLDQYGVTVLEKALQGEMSPIGIVYSLEYLALRPAYSIRLNVDWNRVQKHLSEKFSFDSIIFSADIEKTVDELIEDRAINMEVDTFVPEGEDESGIISRRDQAVNEVRDMVTNTFFQPSLDPMKEDNWDKTIDGLQSLLMLASRGAGSCFKYSKVDLTRIDKKMLNVNIKERTTVKRSIYPQGHLSGIIRDLIREGLDLDKFIIPVDLDDPWFARRKVEVISRANFEEDSLGSINARLAYGDSTRNALLESSTDRKTLEWSSIIDSGKMKMEVNAGYKVNFKGINSAERPISLESSSVDIGEEVFEINPRELYSIETIPIIALNFPWDRYSDIEIHTQYADPDHGIDIKDIFMLNKDAKETKWKLFLIDKKKRQFQYKLIYHRADHKKEEMPWVETAEEQITIRDPWPHKRVLEVVPSLNWDEVTRAFVDLSYEDAENQVLSEASFEFNKDNPDTKTFTVDLVNPNHKQVSYKATILFRDGGMAEVPQSFTLDRRIFIKSSLKGHKVIVIRPQDIDFSTKKLKEMVAELRYEDPDAGLSYSDIYTFKSSEDKDAYFEFDYTKDNKDSYDFRITYRYLNGMTRSEDWKKTDEQELVLPVA